MLKMYFVSGLICMIIVRILVCVANNTQNIRGVDFNDYNTTKGRGKGNWIYLICFVPLLRIILISTAIFLAFARKEDLDKLFKKEK